MSDPGDNHQKNPAEDRRTPGPVNPDYRRKTGPAPDVETYVEGILNGDRATLSRSITLIESSRPDNREMGERILEKCLKSTDRSVRIGITGVPGAGKSTFIEAIGRHIIDSGRTLAVLTVDPSSSRNRGSILGDKTRMPHLAAHEKAFIRPTPASGSLGGVARRSREAMLLCEAAGFNTILMETVGIGQSETTVRSMVDFFLLLVIAGAGDELTGLKRGVMEMVDMIAINKAEKESLPAAELARQQYLNALSLFPPTPSGWKPEVITCSAAEGTGILESWKIIEQYLQASRACGHFKKQRREQAAEWMHETIRYQIYDHFYQHPDVKRFTAEYEKEVMDGKISPFKAANELLRLPDKGHTDPK